jgi:hypothetical protein
VVDGFVAHLANPNAAATFYICGLVSYVDWLGDNQDNTRQLSVRPEAIRWPRGLAFLSALYNCEPVGVASYANGINFIIRSGKRLDYYL